MSHIIGELPYIRGYLRREYTRNHVDGHGDYYPCLIHGLRIVRGRQIQFQSVLSDVWAGAPFLAPVEAFCWRLPTAPRMTRPTGPDSYAYIQPWDCFSSTFGVYQFSMWRNAPVYALPDRKPGRYHCTLDFDGSDLADDDEQHKHLHICLMADGQIAAFPNNRILFEDRAYFDVFPAGERPDFEALGGGPYSAE